MFEGGDFNLYRYCASSPLIYTDSTGEAITTIDGAIEACMKYPTPAQRAQCLENLIGTQKDAGLKVPDKLTKCAKSIRDLANHLEKLKLAQQELSRLRELLKVAKGKANQEALKKAIEDLLKSIKGHIKEIGQKWGEEALKECGCVK